jgi:indolepyruvate ferredoxin oxidoreductase beta subunit
MKPATSALPERATTLLIGALGGEGGGLLADWVVGAARVAGLPVQSTSIPGVAQRTGATTYYVEVYPVALAALGGREPVMSLYPSPGDVDVVVSSELLEAGRSIENGFVSRDRTTLIASTHRIYAIAEKSAMGDGIHDDARILAAARGIARRPILHDLDAIARTRSVALNAILLGIIAGTEALPIPTPAFEAAIRARGVVVEPNLAGFTIGLGVACGEIEAPATAAPPARSWSGAAPAAGIAARVREGFPAEVRDIVDEGSKRLRDYQDAAYAAEYMTRLEPVLDADRAAGGQDDGFVLTQEAARHLALWMSYEDVVRVADLKSRAARWARVRADAGAKPGEPIHVTEFLKPGLEEVGSVLPRAIGSALVRLAARGGAWQRLRLPMRLKSHTISGHVRLRLLAALKRRRRGSYRFAQEHALIARWLDAVTIAASLDSGFAIEVAKCATLLKGYGETHARGRANFVAILETVITPTLAGDIPPSADWLAEARAAALAEPEGKALADALTSPPAAAEAEKRAAGD